MDTFVQRQDDIVAISLTELQSNEATRAGACADITFCIEICNMEIEL